MKLLCTFAAILVPLLSGCLFAPGREGLARLLEQRGEPYTVTRFSTDPQEGERPLAEVRRSLEYWNGAGADGLARWQGVLAPSPPDLYQRLLDLISEGVPSLTLVAYRYDALGLDDLTLVDYRDEAGRVIGFDHVVYPDEPVTPRRGRWVGYIDMAWWEYPLLVLDVPVYVAIGLKEFAGEVVKSPLSVLDSAVFGPLSERRNLLSPVSIGRGALAFVEDWRNGLTALTWRFRTRARHTPLDLTRDLVGAVPLVGPFFDHRSPPETTEPPPASARVAVTQGIHAGDATEQCMEGWRRRIEELRPGATVTMVPYRYGGVFDVIWSVLNLSHGPGYDLADHVVFTQGVRPGEAVDLVGFSGGVQRTVAATRALRDAGVRVNRLTGVAGPVAGNSCAASSSVLLSSEMLEDPVVLTARVVQGLFLLFPTDVAVSTVPGAGGHYTPYFPNGATRAPETGYGGHLDALLR